MSRISQVFNHLKTKGKTAFIPFITAGDGGIESTFLLMQALVKSGADIIELGVPFSDPMADGPVITKAHERALANGTNLKDVLLLVKKFRQSNKITPIVLMGYLNPIEAFGYQAFANAASEHGVDGVLVVDMPPEEAYDLKTCLDDIEIDLIFLVAPTTTNERLKSLARIASGFVYLVALKGVTGAGNLNINTVNHNIKKIRTVINLPIGVGFGIKDSKTAKIISQSADAIIVGSALVTFVEKYAKNKAKMLENIVALSTEISTSIK